MDHSVAIPDAISAQLGVLCASAFGSNIVLQPPGADQEHGGRCNEQFVVAELNRYGNNGLVTLM